MGSRGGLRKYTFNIGLSGNSPSHSLDQQAKAGKEAEVQMRELNKDNT